MKARILAVAGAVAGLCACAPALRIPETVSVSVAVSCVDQEAQRKLEAACPVLRSEDEILALDDFKVIQALRADRGRALECIETQRAAIAVCIKVPAAPSSSSSAGVRE